MKRKPHKIKQKRLVFKKPFFWWTILVFVLIAAGVYFFVFFDRFQVSKIIISGNGKVKTADIEELISAGIIQNFLVGVPLGSSKSIFLVNCGKLSASILNQYPVIGSAEIKKQYPDTIIVNIKDRQPFVILCLPAEALSPTLQSFGDGAAEAGDKTEDCYFLDDSGVAFEKTQPVETRFLLIVRSRLDRGSPDKIEDPRLGRDSTESGQNEAGEAKEIVLGKAAIESNIMAAIVKIKKDFEKKLDLQLKEIDIPNQSRLNATTGEGWQVYFSLDSDIDLQTTKLNYLLEKELPKENRGALQYIDLRYERAYICPKGEKCSY